MYLKELTTYQQMKQQWIGFKHKVTFQQQKYVSIVKNNTKNRNRKSIWFNLPYSPNVSIIVVKKLFSLPGKHFPKVHKLHKLLNSINV